MVAIKRWLIHSFMPPWHWRRAFSAQVLKDIEHAIKQSESRHCGELRFALENALAPSAVWRNLSAKQRAIEVFSQLRIWDTEANCGILLYLLLADREVQIIADRGIAQKVPQQEWDSIAATMQTAFSQGDYRRGVLEGIDKLSDLLAAHFPATAAKSNELPDSPVIIKAGH